MAELCGCISPGTHESNRRFPRICCFHNLRYFGHHWRDWVRGESVLVLELRRMDRRPARCRDSRVTRGWSGADSRARDMEPVGVGCCRTSRHSPLVVIRLTRFVNRSQQRLLLCFPHDFIWGSIGLVGLTLAEGMMTQPSMTTNTIRLHRVLRAKPERVYRAFLDADAMSKWFPPNGYTCKVHHMDAKVGGNFKMSFTNFTTGKSHAFGSQYFHLKQGKHAKPK